MRSFPGSFRRPQALHRSAALCVAVGLGLICSACGSSGEIEVAAAAESSAAPTVSEGTSAADESSTTAAEVEQADVPTTVEQEDDSSEDLAEQPCRMVIHLEGESCVPADAQRIVTMDPIGTLSTLLAVGAPVIGASAVSGDGDPWPAYLAPSAGNIEVVGTSATPNLEAIAALEPDLIITTTEYPGFYDQMSEIAPTVVFGGTFYTDDWEVVTSNIAALVGKTDEYAILMSEYHERAAEIAAQVESLGGVEITRLDEFGGQFFHYSHDCVWFGGIFRTTGISQPAQQVLDCDPADPYSGVGQISPEEFAIFEADIVLVYSHFGGGEVSSDDIPEVVSETPLWSTIAAVKNGNAFRVDDAWGLGTGVFAANEVLNDLEVFLAEFAAG